jgi:hypothetical protein
VTFGTSVRAVARAMVGMARLPRRHPLPIEQSRPMKTSFRLLSITAATVALAFGISSASAQSTSGAIAGQVQATDTVVIQNPETGFNREVKPKADGRYSLRNLQTGTYSVTVKHADGTTDTTKTVSLKVGQTVRVQ